MTEPGRTGRSGRPVPPATVVPDTATVGLHFREAMGRLACGVVVVTTVVDGVPWGLTVSACCSVSMDPPMLLVSLASQTRSTHTIRELGRFGVSVLGANSVEVARFGSMPGQPKFMPHYCGPGEEHPIASPNIAGALAHVDCSVDNEVTAGDHAVFIGRVQRVSGVESPGVWDSPLVYYRREYYTLGHLHDAFR